MSNVRAWKQPQLLKKGVCLKERVIPSVHSQRCVKDHWVESRELPLVLYCSVQFGQNMNKTDRKWTKFSTFVPISFFFFKSQMTFKETIFSIKTEPPFFNSIRSFGFETLLNWRQSALFNLNCWTDWIVPKSVFCFLWIVRGPTV